MVERRLNDIITVLNAQSVHSSVNHHHWDNFNFDIILCSAMNNTNIILSPTKMGCTKGINWFYILQSKQSDGMGMVFGLLFILQYYYFINKFVYINSLSFDSRTKFDNNKIVRKNGTGLRWQQNAEKEHDIPNRNGNETRENTHEILFTGNAICWSARKMRE